jgi:hypothetical protein
MRRRGSLIVLGLVGAAALVATPAAAQMVAVDRPAAVQTGTCAGLGEMVVELANLVITTGDPQGQLGATPVEQSGTVVPYTIADFLAADHAVTVQESTQSATIVACGEVGGALNPDGTLAVGMRGLNGSGLSGVAYFTPIDQFQNTLVTVLLVPSGDGGSTVVDEVKASDEAT